MDRIAFADDEVKTTEANTTEAKAEPPHIKAVLLGMSEDGKQVLVRISEPGDKRVKKLVGTLRFLNAEGSHLEDEPIAGWGFPTYPFDRESDRVLKSSVPEEAVKFRQMIRDDPSSVHVHFDVAQIEFDEEADNKPKRFVSRSVSKDGETTFEYEALAGEYVFCGRVTQRWGRSWITILRGIHMNDPEVEHRVFTLQFIPPRKEPDSHWKIPFGTKYARTNSYSSENSTVRVSHEGSWAVSGPIAVVQGELRLPIFSTELPLQLDGAQVHWIPYRVIDDKTDGIILIFANEIQKVKEMVNLIPNSKIEKMDWDRYVWSE